MCQPATSVLLSARTERFRPVRALKDQSAYIMTPRHNFAFTLIYWLRGTVGEASGCLSGSSTFGLESRTREGKTKQHYLLSASLSSSVAVGGVLLFLFFVVCSDQEENCECAEGTSVNSHFSKTNNSWYLFFTRIKEPGCYFSVSWIFKRNEILAGLDFSAMFIYLFWLSEVLNVKMRNAVLRLLSVKRSSCVAAVAESKLLPGDFARD